MNPRALGHYLKDIVFEIDCIADFMKDKDRDSFCSDYMAMHSVERSIEIIGEAAKNIPEDFREKYPAVPWRDLVTSRTACRRSLPGRA